MKRRKREGSSTPRYHRKERLKLYLQMTSETVVEQVNSIYQLLLSITFVANLDIWLYHKMNTTFKSTLWCFSRKSLNLELKLLVA